MVRDKRGIEGGAIAMTVTEPLISVVIPAYNAEATIEETLRSVQSQSHRHLEIIVVDDGSRDSTAAIAERFAAEDPRIRLMSQKNAGVAAARNTGWRDALSDLIAFVDADDLWAPDKIARQVAALEAAGPKAGLVYAPYAMIDQNSVITYVLDDAPYAGQVLDILLTNNFVGNGSAALVRRQALEDANGFDPRLRDHDAQGCEDILFYCRVAEKHAFAVVPDHLVGYRVMSGNMSSNLSKMLRSWMMVVAEFEERYPEKRALCDAGLRRFGIWLARKAVFARQPGQLLGLARVMARRSLPIAMHMLFVAAPGAAWEIARSRLPRRSRPEAPATTTPSTPARFQVGARYGAGQVQ
jgi:glycosyltransferase involved in cell wall biosynthesis